MNRLAASRHRQFEMPEIGKAYIRRAAMFQGHDLETAEAFIRELEGKGILCSLAKPPRVAEIGVSVYVIGEAQDDYIKIGVSGNPNIRLDSIQACNARPLYLAYKSQGFSRLSAMEIERSVHSELDEYSQGREWFRCGAEVAISAIISRGGLP